MGWIIEFIGKPVNGMEIYLKVRIMDYIYIQIVMVLIVQEVEISHLIGILHWDGNLNSESRFI